MHYEKFADGSVKCIEDEIPFELPEGWAWARLGTVFSTVTGATPSTKDASLYGTDCPFYKPTDLDAGYNVCGAEDSVSEKGYLSGRPLPKFSVLVTCIGATIGKTGYISNAGICNQQINAVLPNSEVLSDYTYFCMCSQYEQEQIWTNSSATTLPILNKSKFDNLLFPIPPHEQQSRIVERIKGLFFFVEKVQSNQESLKTTVGIAKSKILDLAIRGQLVPQDPNDEPASVLLERIRAEKEELIKQGKIKRDNKESVIFRGEALIMRRSVVMCVVLMKKFLSRFRILGRGHDWKIVASKKFVEVKLRDTLIKAAYLFSLKSAIQSTTGSILDYRCPLTKPR